MIDIVQVLKDFFNANNDLFFNFANPKAALGNPQQGAAEQMALLRFVPTVTFDQQSSPTGEAFSLAKADYSVFHAPYNKLVQKSFGRYLFNDWRRCPEAHPELAEFEQGL